MAEYLASIFGTEKDKVNCSFYFKIGACRHGEQCSRLHNKPTFSQTILLQNLYIAPHNNANQNMSNLTEVQAQEMFDEFFEEVFVECESKYGEIEEMNVCDNLGDHLVGNVYIKFRREEDAEKAVKMLNQRWFGGRPVHAELSPVTDFREACCRQYELGQYHVNCVVNSITEAKEDIAADVGGLDLVQHIADRDHQGADVVPGAKFARNNF
ncbi:hypothetical protein ACTXT7_009298 [Hymenolepis weldensis]